jgi:hypothetical protein
MSKHTDAMITANRLVWHVARGELDAYHAALLQIVRSKDTEMLPAVLLVVVRSLAAVQVASRPHDWEAVLEAEHDRLWILSMEEHEATSD